MPKRRNRFTRTARAPKTIQDPVVQDELDLVIGGRVVRAHVQIGKPLLKNGDWGCPLYIEGGTGGIKHIVGVGPIDALANATAIVLRLSRNRKV